MTVDARDRLIDFALERLHAPSDEVDLSQQILDAWESGERGSDVSELVEPAERAPDRAPVPATRRVERTAAPRRTLVRASWAAAALVLVTAAIVLYWTRGSTTPVSPGHGPDTPSVPSAFVAHAASPVRVLRGAVHDDVVTNDIREGDLVVVPHGGTAEIALASGGRFTARDGAVLALTLPTVQGSDTTAARASVALALHRGSVDFACGSEAVAIDAHIAQLAVVPPCAVFHAEVVWDPTSSAAKTAVAAELASLATRDDVGPTIVRTRVESGSIVVERNASRERLVAGTTRDLVAPARMGEVTTDGQHILAKKLEALLRGYPDVDSWQPFGPARTPFEREVAVDLLTLVWKEPQYWSVLERELETRIASYKIEGESFRRVVDFALADASGHGFELGRRLWMLRPQDFRDVQIAMFAERGAFELEREARARVESAATIYPPPVACAVWVARNGDRAGNEVLWRFLEEPPKELSLDDADLVMLDAFTLDALDRGDAWSRGVATVASASEAALDQGRVVVAGLMALSIQYFDEARASKRPVPLEALSNDMVDFVQTRLPSLASVADVRELLARLRR